MKNPTKWGIVGALVLTACGGGDPVDIGNDGVTGEKLEDYAGTWEGYAEAYDFGDGSDRVRVELDVNGEGTITLGDSPPPAISDPDTWPYSLVDPLPGFAYRIVEARVRNSRIEFNINRREAQNSWCELQTPIQDEVNDRLYSCLPNWADLGYRGTSGDGRCLLINDDTGEELEVDCGKFYMCSRHEPDICSCTEAGCSVQPDMDVTAFDGALAAGGDELVGTLLAGERLTVRLNRVR